MADIRIKDLATTASSTASDDFLAVDGSANGTRKLNAYSPTFGGNVVATGTLTVNSTTDSSSKDTGAIITEGGLGVEKSGTFGGNLSVTGTINGTTGVTSADLILGTSGPSVKSTLSARAPRQGLVFDGTAGATTSVPAFGTSDFSVSFISQLTDVSVSQSIVSGTAGALILNISGALYLYKQGTGSLGSVAGVFESGKIAQITVTRSGTSVIVYKNGIQAGTITIASTDFTGATGFIGSTDGTNEKATGLIGGLLIYNRALSASEVVALYESGAPAGADYQTNGAGQKNISAFVNTVVPYTTFSGASSTGFTAAQASGAAYAMSGDNLTVQLGSGATKVRVSGTLTLNSGKTIIPLAVLATSSGTTVSADQTLGAAGAFSVTLTASIVASTSCRVWFGSTGDADYTITNAKVEVLGLLLAPDAAQAGGGLVWYDTSGNAANISWTSNVSWNVPSSGTTGGNRLFTGIVDINNDLYIGSGNIIALARNNPTYNTIKRDSTNGGILLTANSNTLFLKDNGNFLINTLTDVGAKVYSKVADGVLSLGAAGTTKGIRFAHASTYSSIDGVDSSLNGSYQPLQINGSTVQIATNGGTVAASFDTSQNATFAGKLYLKNADTGFDRIGAGTGALQSGGNTTAFWDGNTFAMWSGKALRLGNAYTAGAPTATGYVTIQDSAGNTYKVLVGT